MLITNHFIGEPVETVQPLTQCANPGVAFRIYIDGKNEIPTERIWIFWIITIVCKVIALPVIFTYATPIGSEPQHATPIFMDSQNIIIAQAFRVGWVIPIMDKAFLRCAPAVQSA